jgi:hypothetical protein
VKIIDSGSTEFIEADTVVQVGITSNREKVRELEEAVPVIHIIGDCAEPGKIMEAVASGFLAGHQV